MTRIGTAGLRTTYGSRTTAGHVPERDATAVGRVLAREDFVHAVQAQFVEEVLGARRAPRLEAAVDPLTCWVHPGSGAGVEYPQ